MDAQEARASLEQFAQHYDYDNGYIVQLLEDSPEAFQAFAAAQAMPNIHKALPLDAFFVAKTAVMKTEDCGPCLNLSLKMGVEQGIDRELLKIAVKDPQSLPQKLRDVHDHVVAVIRNENDDADRMERIRNHYGIEAFAELAVVIVGCRIYPTLKRAMGMANHCELAKLDF
ncbi:hypothetical protein Pan97_18750 [Bremerella volcania]|uniref:Carboxymuconolactone decarboxylase family protein n=1 Tax=Bremerella volcania TaxID=2527984 RepID=A0A518C6L0_9BACT|nr:hypothetical protein [Bremerella volcania]QDU74857.1 hypothetical protein Pan97_18750 [Bremerella volcania]